MAAHVCVLRSFPRIMMQLWKEGNGVNDSVKLEQPGYYRILDACWHLHSEESLFRLDLSAEKWITSEIEFAQSFIVFPIWYIMPQLDHVQARIGKLHSGLKRHGDLMWLGPCFCCCCLPKGARLAMCSLQGNGNGKARVCFWERMQLHVGCQPVKNSSNLPGPR